MQTLSDILNENKNIGIVLEGGGARGAYQIGSIKALIENNISYSAICGTSIGAINGAFVAQGDFDKIYEMWQSMSYKDLFDVDENYIKKAINMDINFNVIKYLSKMLNKVIKEKGLDTAKMKNIISNNISEEKLRKSKVKFGLVTFCISDMKPQELLIDEIPEGKLLDYLLATSNLPVFKRQIIDNKKYLDGGAWDNCPVGMLERLGLKDVIVIRAYKRNRIREYKNILKRGNIKMHMIEPVDSLPSILNFDSDNLRSLVKQGYYDTLKLLKGYSGHRYYIDDKSQNILNRISIETKTAVVNNLGISILKGENITDIFYEKALKELLNKIKEYGIYSNKEKIYILLEYIARKQKIERYKIYTCNEFISTLKKCEVSEFNKYEKQIFMIIKDL